jgi:uncharacterized membrane protein YidH (DUF202 family)
MAVSSEGDRPDTQAELANERTYLAWLRTGLALVAAGVAAERILPAEGITWARQLIGVTLILAGVVTAALARRRWHSVDRALRGDVRFPIRSWVHGGCRDRGGWPGHDRAAAPRRRRLNDRSIGT